MAFEIELPLPPLSWARPRAGRGAAFFFTAPKQKKHAQAIAQACRLAKAPCLGGALELTLVFRFTRAKSCKLEFPTQARRNDIDNLAKQVLDAVNGILFVDDSQVVKLCASKEFAPRPGIYLRLTTVVPKPKEESER